jgi:dipeptidyl aminopeptidase/acylaminoacyl peptidase
MKWIYTTLINQFLQSSFERPEEVYFFDHIDQLESAKAITSENQLFTQRNLPRAKLYKWVNGEDDRKIEDILHYPSGNFEDKNLSLFVFLYGDPTDTSLNLFHANWLTWAPMAG